MKKYSFFLCLLLVFVAMSLSSVRSGLSQYFDFPPLPSKDKYGDVVMDNYSTKKGMKPVVFRHWTHRKSYTCRVCHSELYFMMYANATQVRERDNKRGRFCGACHNGKEAFAPETNDTKNCDKCHSYGNKGSQPDISTVLKGLPPNQYGNGVDWVKAIKNGVIHPKDSILDNPKERVRFDKDFYLRAEMAMIPPAKFLHSSHLPWLDCENCHPDIFDIKKKGTHFSMGENLKGRFCGGCHGKVSFPLQDCWRCHERGKRRRRRRR